MLDSKISMDYALVHLFSVVVSDGITAEGFDKSLDYDTAVATFDRLQADMVMQQPEKIEVIDSEVTSLSSTITLYHFREKGLYTIKVCARDVAENSGYVSTNVTLTYTVRVVVLVGTVKIGKERLT